MARGESTDIFNEFKKDDTFSPFLNDDFDVQEHASRIVQGIIISEQLSKLNLGITRLEREIESQVGGHYEDLLCQATGVETLEETLNTMHTRIQTLMAGVERLRVRVVEPYQRVERQTLILGRLQATCELLRRVIRCLALSQRLQLQITGGVKDITKAASSLSELDHLGRDMDLSGLEILDHDQRFVRQARSDVEKQAVSMLDKGIEGQNQTQVGTALQVFHNLGILAPSVERVLDSIVNRLNSSVTQALDLSSLTQMMPDIRKGTAGPGKAVMPAPGQSAQFRATLWNNLDKLMDDIYQACLQTSHLHKVLAKKRDPVTHICFLSQVQQPSSKSDLFTRVWQSVTRILTQEFDKSARSTSFIRQALEVDYPKLVRLYGDLWRRLEGISMEMKQSQNEVFNAGAEPYLVKEDIDEGVDFDPEQALRNTLIPLEKAYLSRSLSRLFDPVNLMFGGTGVAPSKEEVDGLIKTVTSELNVAAVDKSLCTTVARNVVKTLNLFCVKCEHMLVTSGEASQVIGSPTPGQTLNVTVVNQLFYIRGQIDRITSATLAHLPEAVLTMLCDTLQMLDNLMSNGIEPLFSSISDTIEAIVLTMHNEDFSAGATSEGTECQCSLYMRELQNFIVRFANDYISPYHQSAIVRDKINRVACRSLELFVRHASLLRPVGEGGKLRLAADFAQMELAISPLCSRPSELGRAYRIVRSFRPLLFQTPEHIVASPSVGEIIPYSVVLHFLFAKAPPELRSPQQTANWSVSRYSSWLDDHRDERERLQLIGGALEAYAARVRIQQLSEYASVYPVMLKLLEKAVTAHNVK